MSNLKISQLPNSGIITGTEAVPIVQGGVTVQATTQDIANLAGGIPTWQGYVTIAAGAIDVFARHNNTGATITAAAAAFGGLLEFNASAAIFSSRSYIQSNLAFMIDGTFTTSAIYSQSSTSVFSSTQIVLQMKDINQVDWDPNTQYTLGQFWLTIFCNP